MREVEEVPREVGEAGVTRIGRGAAVEAAEELLEDHRQLEQGKHAVALVSKIVAIAFDGNRRFYTELIGDNDIGSP